MRGWQCSNTLNYDFDNVVRTQDIDPVFWETSAFYMFKKNILLGLNRRIGYNPYFVETNRIESIDIDEKEDYDLARKIIWLFMESISLFNFSTVI